MKERDKMKRREKLNIKFITITCIINLLLINYGINILANDHVKIKSLEGMWRFNIGDEIDWKKTKYVDESWDKVYVPSYSCAVSTLLVLCPELCPVTTFDIATAAPLIHTLV